MGEYQIAGGQKLGGTLQVCGGKNAVLPMFAAMVLNGGESVLHNCPQILDTFVSIRILESLGCTVAMEGHTVIVNSAGVKKWTVPEALSGEMRSSILFMGGLLGRFGRADMAYPGGCDLGARPIDYHLKAFKAMGASIKEIGGSLLCKGKMRGAKIPLDSPSVGATENIMLAAVLAKGETVITNAAREPEIVDLQGFLNAMGANVQGAGTDTVVIQGVNRLHSAEYRVMPDRIVTGTYLLAAAITGGEICVRGISPSHMIPVTAKLTEMGCHIKEEEDRLILKAPERLKPIFRLVTQPHPGFPTDLQAPFMAALTLAKGTSMVEENLFSSRIGHVAELERMGASILTIQDNRTFIVYGKKALHGAKVKAPDLRGGAALILAGLAAEGSTTVTEGHHVERGYEEIENALTQLGASILHVV